jgi:hypothetical protein
MTWDLKKTIGDTDGAAGAASAKEPARPKKRSRSRGTRQADATAGARRDAGIVLRSTGPRESRQPRGLPELLYGKDYDCAFCRGTGQLPNESQCPVCRGSGKVSAPAPAVRCAFCHGRGQVPPRSTLTCCVCKGSGIVPVRPPIQVCPDCKGRGKERGQSLYCGRCRGTGVIASQHCSNDTNGVSGDIESEPQLGRKAS